jgi:tRNA threonylcarbamoyl adenosine modification protein (Sua5/YciO/YrdC/YwlC family)
MERADRLKVTARLDGPGLARVQAALEAGAVVALPTDTVYGLAVLPTLPGAIQRLFELKGRPGSIAIALLVADVGQAAQVLKMRDGAAVLASRFWPGALTIVGERVDDLPYELGGDASSVGVRCPDAAYISELCRRVGPIAVTSANRHGQPPVESPVLLRELFGPQLLIADGGPCSGSPSTVVDVRGAHPRLLRAGAIDFEAIAAASLPSGQA